MNNLKLQNNAYFRFHSKLCHFWFVFVKLSEIVGFSGLECHGWQKSYFLRVILLHVYITDVEFFYKDFSKNNCPNIDIFDLPKKWPFSSVSELFIGIASNISVIHKVNMFHENNMLKLNI